MSAILKPRIPQIDWGNQLTKGLVFDAPFFELGGSSTQELVNKIQGTVVSSGATWKQDLYGTDLDFSAAASSVSYTSPTPMNSLAQISIEALIYIRSNGGGSIGRIVHKKNNTKGYFQVYTQTTTLTLDIGLATSDAIYNIPQPSLNTWHPLIFTCSNLANPTGTITAYLDGVAQTITVQSNGSGALVADDTSFYIGNRGDGTRNFDGKIAYTRIWNRVLTATEAQKLYVNPFRIYRQPKTGIYLPR